ncbi:MAG: Hsp20/alpha crystallin family protein [Gammaproteobacteria bacterium]|nr:MAG: Hsp20/alpha crystallin family protein [Gammaproteobacteria bacterium]
MAPLRQLREGVGRAWEGLAEGWQQLLRKAWDALTRFTPPEAGGPGPVLETVEDQVLAQAPRWGLLPADLSATEEALVARIEIPGLDPAGLEVLVEGDRLRVRGEKRPELEEERAAGGARLLLVERAYGRFERLLPLPEEVEPEGARARYRQGVLTVVLPRRTRTRRIPVQAAGEPGPGEGSPGPEGRGAVSPG